MKRSFIIPTLLILLLPVQIINADVQSQNSVLHQHSIEIERCINNDIRKADSLVKTGKPDEALTYYKSSLKSKDSLYILLPTPRWKKSFHSTTWISSYCKENKGTVCFIKPVYTSQSSLS